ncbi:4-alpha-glucanotransferase [Heliophilum fasciatum]|uniref:4-alpha-glucanotransferase n=1 Tax=Heliophilum fasciatum TaxID=35700 RepID=A0A4R2RGI3_9FIRM|nr:4-alpha-glucanotransferase [Heliophilum fasciatum]MCW2279045.1 4-alpha-glucanotransferase [Heliophilum fasciatum]TCP61509.1 4-alpha-glucanotransferase [Heliophilum fasciatum]
MNERASGILLHVTSLPGPHGIGDLGPTAYRFVDMLKEGKQRYWQVLPLGPLGYGDSPYSALSAFAGNPLLISLEMLVDAGLLSEHEVAEAVQGIDPESTLVDYEAVRRAKGHCLRIAVERFLASSEGRQAWEHFCAAQAAWLEPYALFMAIKEDQGGVAWTDWTVARDGVDAGRAYVQGRADLQARVAYYQGEQYFFFQQWAALKAYGAEQGVCFIGDMPIYVAWDSADTWSQRHLFVLDSNGVPAEVGGVPPDYFSEEGQLWGNPIYDWAQLSKQNFAWWVDRFRHTLTFVDIVRLDHFRGFQAYWAVPYGEKTAINGAWKLAPGEALFQALTDAFGGSLPVIAEDLGVITDEVIQLRDHFGFPGIKLLQFAFDSRETSDFIPYRYERNCVVYTGTHDNDTTRGWLEAASPEDRALALDYMNSDGRDGVWDFIRLGMATVANTALFPWQDVLGIGSEGRMNLPGKMGGNWAWRFTWAACTPEQLERLAHLTCLYGRQPVADKRVGNEPDGEA